MRLGREEPEYIDLGKPGETDTGSVCDIVVRENIAIRSVTTRDKKDYPRPTNSVTGPGCLSRILIFIYPGSQIPNPTTATK